MKKEEPASTDTGPDAAYVKGGDAPKDEDDKQEEKKEEKTEEKKDKKEEKKEEKKPKSEVQLSSPGHF